MPAQEGNKLASKWTQEKTIEKLSAIDKAAQDRDVKYLGQAMTLAGVHQHAWSYWKKIWAGDEDLMDRMYFIEQLFENKLLSAGMDNRCHTGMAMMVLRAKYGYVEERWRLQADRDRRDAA